MELRPRRPPALLLLALAVTTCAAPQALSRADLLARLEASIGPAACDSDAQCHTIGEGARPCGGPASYRAWSSVGTDAAALKAAAEALARFDREAAAREGRVSDCRVRPDPGAVCRAAPQGGKRCVLATPTSAR